MVTVTTNIYGTDIYHPSKIFSYKVPKIAMNNGRWGGLVCEYCSVLLLFSDAPISSIVETIESSSQNAHEI